VPLYSLSFPELTQSKQSRFIRCLQYYFKTIKGAESNGKTDVVDMVVTQV
jgi:hypothetical protein